MHTAADGNRIARMTFDGSALSDYKVLVNGIRRTRTTTAAGSSSAPTATCTPPPATRRQPDHAQDQNSLNGKILRMTTTAAAGPGNPFGNRGLQLRPPQPAGHRLGLAGPAVGSRSSANSTYDELNLIKPGSNYGWPTCEGSCTYRRDDRTRSGPGPSRRPRPAASRSSTTRLHGRPARRAAVAHPDRRRERRAPRRRTTPSTTAGCAPSIRPRQPQICG